jgi:pimeloyl-ACP methyl ester carboxylesterase
MNIGALRVLAVQECPISEEGPMGLRHIELYSTAGLVTFFWHGNADSDRVVLCAGGAMGGLLGPGDSFFHELGIILSSEHNIATIRVGWKRPNDLQSCVDDLVAAALFAEQNGTEKIVTVGHSFGGAVAIGAAIEPSPIAESVKGVVTLATQSAGCENAAMLKGRPLLLVHGDSDTILPHWSSEMVNELAGGHGRVEILEGAGHLLRENGSDAWLRANVPGWIVQTLA